MIWTRQPTRGRALVTGGAGFLGSNLVDRLVADRWEVLVVDDLSSGRLSRLAEARRFGKVAVHQMDIRSEHLAAAVAKFVPDRIFHLAAQTSVAVSMSDPRLDADVNITGTLNLLEAARLCGSPRLVFVSTGGAIYGRDAPLPTAEDAAMRPESPYGISKLMAEQYLDFWERRWGLDCAVIRPANIYGPRQDSSGEGGVVAIFSRACMDRTRPTIFGSGEDTRDYVFVEDVVDALIAAGDAGGSGVYNIGTGVETSTREVFEAVAREARFGGGAKHGPARPGDLPRSVLDSSRAHRELGWSPGTSLQEGIEATVAWFGEN